MTIRSTPPFAESVQSSVETVLSGFVSLVKKIPELWQKPDPIVDKEDLEQFLTLEIAKITGLAIMKYSQKRLGKIHYNLMKDRNYAEELVSCQIKIHAEIVADIGHLIAKLMKFETIQECETFKQLLEKVHNDYVQSSPEGMLFSSCLTEEHFSRSHVKVRDLAIRTGKFLFQTLPMTDIMMPSDVKIFQGQIGFAYVNMLGQLSKRVDYTDLRKNFESA